MAPHEVINPLPQHKLPMFAEDVPQRGRSFVLQLLQFAADFDCKVLDKILEVIAGNHDRWTETLRE